MYFDLHDYPKFFEQFYRRLPLRLSSIICPACVGPNNPVQSGIFRTINCTIITLPFVLEVHLPFSQNIFRTEISIPILPSLEN